MDKPASCHKMRCVVGQSGAGGDRPDLGVGDLVPTCGRADCTRTVLEPVRVKVDSWTRTGADIVSETFMHCT
jgi:hypothetical protein